MHHLLAVFNHYDFTHPLWGLENYAPSECKTFCVSLDRGTLEDSEPDALVCDSLAVPREMLEKYQAVFFLTDQTYYQMRDAPEDRRQEYLEKLRAAGHRLTISGRLATLFNQEFGVQPAVQYPAVLDQTRAEPKYIYYDYGFTFVSQLQAMLPREEFRCLGSLADLGTAKLYLAYPPTESFWYLSVAVAANRFIPIVSVERPNLSEFLANTGVTLPEGSPQDRWFSAIRTCLRDRNYFSEKLKTARSKYGQMNELSNRIRMALRGKPSRTEKLQITKFTPEEDASMEIINQRKRRMPVVPPHHQPSSGIMKNTVLLTGGIGDVFTIESHWTDEQRASLETILYATHKQPMIQALFEALPNYPNLKNHKVVWADFKDFWCFCYKDEVIRKLEPDAPADLRNCEDWGIIPKFPLIGAGVIKFNGSSFLRHKLTDISHFCLPPNYVTLQPYSTDKRVGARDYNDADWCATLYWLTKRNLKGVVINKGDEKVPENPNIIDLSNKTNVLEAVEVLKGSRGYIGIDSWLCVLAAQLFEDDFLAIKSHNGHCYENKHIYFAPKKRFDFLSTDIVKVLKF
jgi:hypothetical protein